jgi:hypothetical protein
MCERRMGTRGVGRVGRNRVRVAGADFQSYLDIVEKHRRSSRKDFLGPALVR